MAQFRLGVTGQPSMELRGDDPASAADSPYGPKHHRPFGRYFSERTGCTNL
jgi:hypothetical protein